MAARSQKYELSKLRMLQFLSDPSRAEYGALTDTLPAAERGVASTKLLADMLESGLIERRSDPFHEHAKPYFISGEGSRYLEDARQKALFPEIGHRQDWATNETAPDMHQTVADFIRTLPEFRDSGDDRIREVSQQFAERIANPVGRNPP